jgi:hypothetical protein
MKRLSATLLAFGLVFGAAGCSLFDKAADTAGAQSQFSPETNLTLGNLRDSVFLATVYTGYGYANALEAHGLTAEAAKLRKTIADKTAKGPDFTTVDQYEDVLEAAAEAAAKVKAAASKAPAATPATAKAANEALLDLGVAARFNEAAVAIAKKASKAVGDEVKAQPARASQAKKLLALADFATENLPKQGSNITATAAQLGKVAVAGGLEVPTPEQIAEAVKQAGPGVVDAWGGL